MTCSEKLSTLKTLLGIEASDTTQDETLGVYLSMSMSEILNWMYIKYPDIPEDALMPEKYDIVQVQAVVAGYNLQGGENELKHTENGIIREFDYSSMVDWIHGHVQHIAKVG